MNADAQPLEQQHDRKLTTPVFWLVAVVLGVAFFALENQWHFSTHDEFLIGQDQVEQYTGSGDNVRRVGFLVIGALGVWLFATGRRQLKLDNPLAWLVLGLFAWCAASLVWSDEMSMTLRRLIVMGCCFLGAVGVSRRLDARQLCLLALIVFASFSAVGVLSEATMGMSAPALYEYRFGGTTHPNTQGLYLATVCLAVVCMAPAVERRRVLLILVGVAALGLLICTRSRLALVAMLASVGALWLLRIMLRGKTAQAVGGALALFTVLIVVQFFGSSTTRWLKSGLLLGRTEEAETLTGRIPLWQELTNYVGERPFTGYGYQAFWTRRRTELLSEQMNWALPHAHNAYIDILLGVGLLGAAALLLIVLLGLVQTARRCQDDSAWGCHFAFGLLVMGAVHGLAESTFVMPMFVPFLAACGVFQTALFAESTAPAVISPPLSTTPQPDTGAPQA